MFDFEHMHGELQGLSDKAMSAVKAYGDTTASALQSRAMEDRPWTDRTAQARQRMKGYCIKTDRGVRIYLAHGVDYGAFLEFAYEKRYAIIYPTLRKEAPKIMRGFGKLLGGVK